MESDAKSCGADETFNGRELLELLIRELADRTVELGVEGNDSWYIEHLARKIVDLANTTQ